MEDCKDRTDFQPKHQGDHILPNTPFLAQLLRHAHKGLLAVRDDLRGIERSYGDLIADGLTVRNTLAAQLSSQVLSEIDNGREIFVGVLAPGGYDYAVAVIAVGAYNCISSQSRK